jgi:hypothetical protein
VTRISARIFPALFFALVLAVLFATRASAEDDAAARTLFDQMLAAQDARDYDAFVVNADDQLKAALTRDQFMKASDVLQANAAGGPREVTFLGELNQRGYEVYLYRLRFKTGDLLATMALQDGKVAGIWLK